MQADFNWVLIVSLEKSLLMRVDVKNNLPLIFCIQISNISRDWYNLHDYNICDNFVVTFIEIFLKKFILTLKNYVFDLV